MDQFEIGFVEEYDIVFNAISKAVLVKWFLAKWLSVRLRTKWFWVRVQLQSLLLLFFATEVINHTSIGLIKILFLIDSMEIYLFGIQCRNVIWNLLKQTTR